MAQVKSGLLPERVFFEHEAHKVPLDLCENVRDEELEERPTTTAVSVLLIHPTEVLRERRSRDGGVEGKVKAEEGDMTMLTLCEWLALLPAIYPLTGRRTPLLR